MSYHSAARLGRYELIGQLATGGMAEIHLARLVGEGGFEKIVVVKRLLPELVASSAFRTMFLEEAKLVARLDHPNICEVYELGRDGAEYFIVMPYLDGIPASALRAEPRVAAGVVVQACAGLHYAHELPGADLVHRDVSPSNLFVTSAGVVKVLDFGVAKVRGANETEVGTIKGKVSYMAPEQLLGEPLDRRCDVFALGIVLFELATGKRLFARESAYLCARAILEEPIPRADGVPPELADVIARALERDRDARFADARELGRAVEQAMAAHGGVATADEIAGALRDEHSVELEEQRTRQHRIVDLARSRGDLTKAAVADAAAADAAAIDAAAEAGARRARPEASQLETIARVRPARERGERRRWLAIAAAATVVAGGAGIALWQLSGGGADVRQPDTVVRDSDTVVRGSDTVVRGSDTAVRGSDDVAGADIEIEGSGSDARGSAVRRRIVRHTPRVLAPGTFSIDSTPFATIFVDDHELGVTPLIHQTLPAGHHKLRAVLKDGRARDLDLDVPAGKAASPIRLSW